MRIKDIKYDEKDNILIENISKKQIANLIEVAMYYSDPNTYFAIGIFPDPPCGDFINDFDDQEKPGAFAREVLKSILNEWKNK